MWDLRPSARSRDTVHGPMPRSETCPPSGTALRISLECNGRSNLGCCCEWLLARKLSVADEHSDMIDADSRNGFSLFGAGDLIELGQHGHALQLAWRSSYLRSGRRQASAHA